MVVGTVGIGEVEIGTVGGHGRSSKTVPMEMTVTIPNKGRDGVYQEDFQTSEGSWSVRCVRLGPGR